MNSKSKIFMICFMSISFNLLYCQDNTEIPSKIFVQEEIIDLSSTKIDENDNSPKVEDVKDEQAKSGNHHSKTHNGKCCDHRCKKHHHKKIL